jgi:carbamoyl-phosphate synthase/aspartate carbamoyltransferase/dihydroorotase
MALTMMYHRQAPATPLRLSQADNALLTPVKHVAATLPGLVEYNKATINSLRGKAIVSIGSLSEEQIASVMKKAAEMRDMVAQQGGDDSLKGKVLASLFYEPSTRTNCSFQAAMLRLGGTVLSVNESSSSVAKGETLSDSVRCLECYADAVVLRHPRAGAAAEAAGAMRKPLLNAGDGVGEHPTQALLDLFTIIDELCPEQAAKENMMADAKLLQKMLHGKVVTMVGDLKNGRTVHSLAGLLGRFGVTLRYVAPVSLSMPTHIVETAAENGCPSHSEHQQLDEDLLRESDILYVTRVQKERFERCEDYDAVKDAFVITPETLKIMKSNARVMHPLPRVGEIDPACDQDPRAAYFRQMENGMYVRMALLRLILG